MRIIKATIPMLESRTLVIGFQAENQRTQVRIDCASILAEYPHATPSLAIKPPSGETYPVFVDRDGDEVVWTILSGNLALVGDGELQLTFVKDSVIAKTVIGHIRILRSLVVTGEMPDPVAQWVDDANRKLAEVDEQIEDLEGMVDTATDAAIRAEQSASTASTAAEQAAESATTATEKATEATNAAGIATEKAAEAEQSAQAAQIDYSALSEEVTDLKSSLVLVQPNQPTEEVNKLWIDSDTVTETEIPTMDEFNGLKRAVVLVQPNQPTEDANKLWIDSDTVTETEVPTIDEFNGLNSAINSKLDAPETAGTSGQVLTSDGQGGQSWETPSGGGAVQDVQVNGVSVLQDGVANVPIASAETYGVVRTGSVSVSGTTPTINALSGVRYICGEVSTITITVPASGIIDVVFTSGSTPAVLTINGTVRWANGFDPDNLDADTVYELNIADGLGVAGTWT